MSKVAEFINCLIDNTYYNNKAKWEVIDFFIIGFFLFMGTMLLMLMMDLSCVQLNYYHDNCNSMRNTIEFFEGLSK